MDQNETIAQFIQTWGTLGAQWGINRTMAQIHALMLVSPDPMSTDAIMERLTISRGNANSNIRQLVEWDLLRKELVPGDRKEYFKAEKDIWEVARRIAVNRRRRELDPMMNALKELQDEMPSSEHLDAVGRELSNAIDGILQMGEKAGSLMDLVLKLDGNNFFKLMIGRSPKK